MFTNEVTTLGGGEHRSDNLSISTYLSVYLIIYLTIYLSTYLSVYLLNYLSSYISTHNKVICEQSLEKPPISLPTEESVFVCVGVCARFAVSGVN